jgi:hypothetical protein
LDDLALPEKHRNDHKSESTEKKADRVALLWLKLVPIAASVRINPDLP